jgi:hypothetical protein
MHRSPSLPSAAAIPVPDVPRELLTRGPPPGSGRASVGSGAAEVIRYLTEDHDRIAQRMNDVVVRRIFAAGLDLHVALGLIGDHSGAGKIYHALDELDQAIRDIRDTIFDRSPPVHHASLIKTHDGPPCTPTLARAVLMDSRQQGGSSHSWRAGGVPCSVLPERLDAGDSEPEELFPVGELGRVGPIQRSFALGSSNRSSTRIYGRRIRRGHRAVDEGTNAKPSNTLVAEGSLVPVQLGPQDDWWLQSSRLSVC